jgi:hypothetical protein
VDISTTLRSTDSPDVSARNARKVVISPTVVAMGSPS